MNKIGIDDFDDFDDFDDIDDFGDFDELTYISNFISTITYAYWKNQMNLFSNTQKRNWNRVCMMDLSRI